MSTDPPMTTASVEAHPEPATTTTARRNSESQQSDTSQTAAEFIRDQELLEADAREALPYSIETCTKILGPLRQNVFACLTCNPPPASPSQQWTPAGVCYACSIQCHGEHNLVEIFQKRNFTCDCGTTRIPSMSPCTIRTNNETNTRGGVHSEEADVKNKYNQNFKNRFCGCECDYDPFQQKGTMFQCLGLGTIETGGCGEDWYHPGCLVGMGPEWVEKMKPAKKPSIEQTDGALATITEGSEAPKDSNEEAIDDEEDPPMPPGFPEEDDFESFICYKCVEANPWIKAYAGTPGFLPPVFLNQPEGQTEKSNDNSSNKRKVDDDAEEQVEAKRVKSDDEPETAANNIKAGAETATKAEREVNSTEDVNGPEETPVKDEPKTETDASNDNKTPEPAPTNPQTCKLSTLPKPPTKLFSLFFTESFRQTLCNCPSCYTTLLQNPHLLEEEEVYEPPLSDDASQHGDSTASLLERGESALKNVDRVKAIEGVMAYNHLKEQLKPFFREFAESGRAIGAEDIKAYFAKLRGDEEGIREAGEGARDGGKREQRGY